MYNFKSLKCYNCSSVILSLPEPEVIKLDGLNFICECCGHQNLLQQFKFIRSSSNDINVNIFSIESFAV